MEVSGRTVEGRKLRGSDRLSHTVPAMPEILSPVEDSVVDPASLTVSWEPVTEPAGIEIGSYQVIVAREQRAERVLEASVDPGVTSLGIPAEFLDPGTDYKVEVLAKERSGNQTITEIPFSTS
jgi:hypothetical protein